MKIFENSTNKETITIFERRGYLYLQFYINNKKKQKSTRLKDTKKNREILKKEVIPKLRIKIRNGELFKEDKVKNFEWYASKYLKSKENLKTYFELQNIVTNQFFVYFRNRKINEIKRGEIKEFIDNKLEKVTVKRAREILNVLKAIFDIAVEYEHIDKNPCKLIKMPSHKPLKEMQPFTEKEVELLLNTAKNDKWFQNFVATLIFTGARPGEIIALKVEDINLKDMYININKRIKKGIVDTPKTKSSIRKIPIFEILKPYLISQIKLAKTNKTDCLFFTRNKTCYYSVDRLHRKWYKLLEEAKIEKRVMYNTRHTFATLAIKNGLDLYFVSQTLGHKNIQETLTTYTKFLPNENLKISRQVNILKKN